MSATPRSQTPSRSAAPLPAGDAAAIRLVGICAWYGPRPVLQDVDLHVQAGSVTAIIGSPDAGKSTLLKVINRLAELERGFRVTGTARLGKDDTSTIDATVLRRRVGMVFERPTAFQRSVSDNVAFGLQLAGIVGAERDRRVEAALRQVGLWEELPDRAIAADRLDAGQRQRLCMARALALQPQALLFDEPTRWLHPADAARVESVIASLRGTITVLVSATDAAQAGRIADHVALLDRGRIVEYGPTGDVFTNPKQPETEAYLSRRYRRRGPTDASGR